jgi:uroporphyrinogen decarboxylase
MTPHKQRLEKCISGVKPDRPPISLWRHFPVDDQSSEGLAKATLDFQATFDFDFIKVTPASSFCIKDWGAEDRWLGATEGTREYTKRVINDPEDWSKLFVLDPYNGFLHKQLNCLELISKQLNPETPVIQTIFSPLSQAKNLVGPEKLIIQIRKNPDEVLAGLQTITESTGKFIEAAIRTGISGIFYAVQHAQFGLLSRDEYNQFGRKFDLSLLSYLENLWLNILHLHGTEIMFDLFCDYPFQVINWHDRETYPTLSEGKIKFPGVVCGGMEREKTMVLGTPSQVKAEALKAITETEATRLILSTGCVLPITTPVANIHALRGSV